MPAIQSRDHRLAGNGPLAGQYQRHGPLGQVDITFAAETDQTDTLAGMQIVTLAAKGDDTPCNEAGDLDETDIAAVIHGDTEGLALVLVRRLVERGVEEPALVIGAPRDPADDRRAVHMHIEDIHEHRNPGQRLIAEFGGQFQFVEIAIVEPVADFGIEIGIGQNHPGVDLKGPLGLGAALGFGAQRLVQDLLSGFFIITEKQYGFGDIVRLTLGSSNDALGTVEEVTLRVTKLRTAEGEMYTIPNGQIMKTLNLSKDWARAVVDIPVPSTADLGWVNEVLQEVCDTAMDDHELSTLLLGEPKLRGVESIELGMVNLQLVARTLPGKQFEAGRRLRLLVVAALARAGIATSAADNTLVQS